ncbi:Crp/Fnr family transcriptional regulator [Aequorivita sp. F47161]|uniref:Crp/Fnr family transcriptional regulator n=1 Tax=Aequorivita vitellina TaxID=2874475 RepID=A0A9X1U0E9_9FLAO|nr:Crp/Fnr family transcriptional regulator [Aequorivita vitellina]MCG2418939.1 Crp/Fnr family transcriptional regulator [Aequorivita vitellina]MCZ4320258.1 Crp/Fnr family transcriptional regulator [Aequorivita viscosa]
MIPENLLLDYNATLENIDAAEVILHEKKRAHFYFQIKTGEVKMYNLNDQGKEFVQGIFYKGESFGEPPLFGDFKYPASAAAVKPTELYKLSKTNLFELLTHNPEVNLKFTKAMAKRLFYKATILKEISVHTPEHRILALIDLLKKKYGSEALFQVELTRQQIADLTGLRVETVIRAIKQLEQDGELKLIKHKVFR